MINEKAEKLTELFNNFIQNHYIKEKSAHKGTPLCSLSANELKVLITLSNRNYPSIKEISEELSIPMSTLTGIFNKLVDKKLVARGRCDFDHRIVRVNLSPMGMEAVSLKKKQSCNFALNILSRLTEPEQEQLIYLLEKIQYRK